MSLKIVPKYYMGHGKKKRETPSVFEDQHVRTRALLPERRAGDNRKKPSEI